MKCYERRLFCLSHSDFWSFPYNGIVIFLGLFFISFSICLKLLVLSLNRHCPDNSISLRGSNPLLCPAPLHPAFDYSLWPSCCLTKLSTVLLLSLRNLSIFPFIDPSGVSKCFSGAKFLPFSTAAFSLHQAATLIVRQFDSLFWRPSLLWNAGLGLFNLILSSIQHRVYAMDAGDSLTSLVILRLPIS